MNEEDFKIVLMEESPFGNLEAIVEQDSRVAYLYLRAPENESFGVKSCWLRNLAKAPLELDVEDMKQGQPPMLPANQCKHPDGVEPLMADRLRLVWLPEGDGGVLLEDDKFLGIIPALVAEEGFSGYSRDCIGQTPLCWELTDTSVFDKRILEAEKYWQRWDQDPYLWQSFQNTWLECYESELGVHSKYFAIDGGDWPPKAIAKFDQSTASYLLTLGLSLTPQPAVEMYHKEPDKYRRIEFAAGFSPDLSEEFVLKFASFLSAKAKFPWEMFTFFGHGHTLDCDLFKSIPELESYNSVLLVTKPIDAPEINPPLQDEEQVNLLWAVPISEKERQLAQEKGSNALLDQLQLEKNYHLIGGRKIKPPAP